MSAPTLAQISNFFSKVRKAEHCWVWTAARDSFGYGQIAVSRRTTKAHRFSYQIHFGDIPKQLFVLHWCDNPPCVNPDHLYLGDHKRNADDMTSRGRNCQQKKTHCRHGHPFSWENLIIKHRPFERICRTCRNSNWRAYYNRRRYASLG